METSTSQINRIDRHHCASRSLLSGPPVPAPQALIPPLRGRRTLQTKPLKQSRPRALGFIDAPRAAACAPLVFVPSGLLRRRLERRPGPLGVFLIDAEHEPLAFAARLA